jgi:hypothetical protein
VRGEQHCGAFFVRSTFNGGMPLQIIFTYRNSDGGKTGGMVAASDAATEIVAGKATPTVDEAEKPVVFRMGPESYAASAGCVPAPKVQK